MIVNLSMYVSGMVQKIALILTFHEVLIAILELLFDTLEYGAENWKIDIHSKNT